MAGVRASLLLFLLHLSKMEGAPGGPEEAPGPVGVCLTQAPAGATSGATCTFPFIYRNSSHSRCTYADSPVAWCATQVDGNQVMVPNRYGDCDEATCALEECGLTGKDSYWTTWCGGVCMCNSDGRAKCSSCPTTSAPPSPQPRDIEAMGAY